MTFTNAPKADLAINNNVNYQAGGCLLATFMIAGRYRWRIQVVYTTSLASGVGLVTQNGASYFASPSFSSVGQVNLTHLS